MRKNGSRLISLQQYRLTDLFIFAVILAVGELLPHYATVWFSGGATFTISFTVAVVAIVMLRWGWPSVFYAAVAGVLYCALNGGSGRQYAIYCIGNMFIALMLIPRYLIGADKLTSRWWSVALFTLGAWLCVCLGRACVSAVSLAIAPIEGTTVGSAFAGFILYDILSPVISTAVMVLLRRSDGLLEDQKGYLSRVDRERKEAQRLAASEDELAGIDEEALEILNKENDLYK